MASGKQIYVRFKGRTLGPFTHEHVQRLATRGQISRMHELSTDGLSWAKPEKSGIQFGDRVNVQKVSPGSRSAAPHDAVTSAAPQSTTEYSRSNSPVWHVQVAGVARGTVTHKELINLFQGGRIGSDALLWRDGLQNWIPVHDAIRTHPVNNDKCSKKQWYILRSGAPVGSFDERSIRDQISNRELGPTDLVCPSGGDIWKVASDAFDFHSTVGLSRVSPVQQNAIIENHLPPKVYQEPTGAGRRVTHAETEGRQFLVFVTFLLPLLAIGVFVGAILILTIKIPELGFVDIAFHNKPTSKLTVSDFRKQVAFKEFEKADFYEKYGTPISITTFNSTFLNYQCKDANVRVEVHNGMWVHYDRVLVLDISENF